MTTATARTEPGDEQFADDLKPGTKLLLGQFTIDSFLNRGGFGVTYLARDSLDRQVVIKECFPVSLCRRSGTVVDVRIEQRREEFRSIVQLFLQEAQNLSRLDHPYIIKVHQVFEDNETAYMAMDYIQGPDLLETVEGKVPRLPPDQIVTLLRKMLDAVGYLHDQGMLHRDISPDNILLNKFTNHPVLIDFGAAKKDVTRKSRALSGLRVVKDGYSPQEFYIEGSKQAACSDLYALAASFHHLIANESPKTSRERLAAIAGRDPDPQVPLSGRFPDYPASFLAAIDKAMSIFPRDRLQSVADWKAMLRDLNEGPAVPTDGRRAAVEVAAPRAPAMPGRAVPMVPPSQAAALMPKGVAKLGAARIPANNDAVLVADGGSRRIPASAAAALALLAVLLALPTDLAGRLRGALFAEASAAPFAAVLSVRLPFVAAPDEPNRIAARLPGSPVWMQPGQRIVEVNGQPLQPGADPSDLLAEGADLSQVKVLNVIIGFETAPGSDIVRKMESLRVQGELRLPGGLVFALRETADGVLTEVVSVPTKAETDLRPGDVLLTYLPTGETVATGTALADILRREGANGVATYGFAVQRNADRIEATFRLEGDA